jgi:predicted RNA-binding Zn-ribbon protein involved in translation (DUF1610 family)
MPRDETLKCSNCGGTLQRPLRSKCPNCGAVIRKIRVRRLSAWWPQIIIAAMFALLVVFLLLVLKP